VIPFLGEHTIHGLIRGGNTVGRLVGVMGGGFNWAGQHPPGWNGVGEPGAEVEVFAGGIPQDVEGGLQVPGMASQTPKVTVWPSVNFTGRSARTNAPTFGTCIMTESCADP
jgi:hypothetical protein